MARSGEGRRLIRAIAVCVSAACSRPDAALPSQVALGVAPLQSLENESPQVMDGIVTLNFWSVDAAGREVPGSAGSRRMSVRLVADSSGGWSPEVSTVLIDGASVEGSPSWIGRAGMAKAHAETRAAFVAALSTEGRHEAERRATELRGNGVRRSARSSGGLQAFVQNASDARTFRSLVEQGSTVRGARVGAAARAVLALADGAVLEVHFDTSTSLITEENLVKDGRLRMQRSATYRQDPGTGAWVRELLRSEVSPERGSGARMVLEERFTPTSTGR